MTAACNNWADIGLPEVYNDPDLASFNGAVAQESPTDHDPLRQAGGRCLRHRRRRAAGRSTGSSTARSAAHGQTTAMHLDNLTTQVWSFTGGPASATDANWVKQEAGTDRRCFVRPGCGRTCLLQAKVCQSGNGGPAVNVLAGAMQNTLGQ